jgi:hypothetical protein
MKPLELLAEQVYTIGNTGGNTMSKAISVKIDEEVFLQAERIVRRQHTNRNAYINKAIRLLNRLAERDMLRGVLERESLASRKENAKVLRDFDEAIRDGLEER